jgi:hypothetical protein
MAGHKNQMPVFYYGLGVNLYFFQSKFHPYLSFGPGLVSFQRTWFKGSDPTNSQTI